MLYKIIKPVFSTHPLPPPTPQGWRLVPFHSLVHAEVIRKIITENSVLFWLNFQHCINKTWYDYFFIISVAKSENKHKNLYLVSDQQMNKIFSIHNLCKLRIYPKLFKLCKKLATLVESDPKAPFSIATILKCQVGRYSFPWIDPLYPWSVPYNAEC